MGGLTVKATRISGLLATAALIALAGLSASASGAANQITFDGSCSVHGTATFDSPYLKGNGPPGPVGYHFKTTGDPAKSFCDGKLNGKDGHYLVNAYVDGGKGANDHLSCQGSVGSGGTGALTFPGGLKFPLTLDIAGVLTEVGLHITDGKGGNAFGEASFRDAASADPAKTLGDCNGTGVKSLEFNAMFQGAGPITADAPAAAPAANNTPPPAAPSGGDQPAPPPPADQGQAPPAQDQGGVKGEKKSSPKKAKKAPCGKGKKGKAKAKACAKAKKKSKK
jgi:hypothetical protein